MKEVSVKEECKVNQECDLQFEIEIDGADPKLLKYDTTVKPTKVRDFKQLKDQNIRTLLPS